MYASILLATEGESSGGSALSLLILPLIVVGMYFMLIRPQRKRMKQQSTLQASLSIGDEVVTTSGIYGFITGEEEDRFWLEVDDDVQLRVARAAIQGKVNTAETDDDADDDDDGEADDGAPSIEQLDEADNDDS